MTRITTALFALAFSLQAFAEATPELDIDPEKITVSGISSGGSMAHQLHIAYPDLFSGAGIIAGAPYGCAAGEVATAFARCIATAPDPFPLDELLAAAKDFATQSAVGDPKLLSDDRVWLFHGAQDAAVARGVGDALAGFYSSFVGPANITYITDVEAAHTFPTEDQGSDCTTSEAPWIGACGYDGAGALLSHLYTELNAPQGVALQQAVEIELPGAEQAVMASTAWLYVPAACEGGNETCALHVALHGCAQSTAQVGKAFVEQTGYLPWAEANNIVVLFPQAAQSATNPLTCWDWWGYTGANYLQRDGAQMKVLADWVASLTDKPGSQVAEPES